MDPMLMTSCAIEMRNISNDAVIANANAEAIFIDLSDLRGLCPNAEWGLIQRVASCSGST